MLVHRRSLLMKNTLVIYCGFCGSGLSLVCLITVRHSELVLIVVCWTSKMFMFVLFSKFERAYIFFICFMIYLNSLPFHRFWVSHSAYASLPNVSQVLWGLLPFLQTFSSSDLITLIFVSQVLFFFLSLLKSVSEPLQWNSNVPYCTFQLQKIRPYSFGWESTHATA